MQEGKEPSCVISDQQASIREALSEMVEARAYSGVHCYDSFHILRNLKKKTAKGNMPRYAELIRARNRQLY